MSNILMDPLGSVCTTVRSSDEILLEFQDTLQHWMSCIGVSNYTIKPGASLSIFTELSLVGKAQDSQIRELLDLVKEYGYEKISKLGILIKFYNDKLNYGLLIEYPIDSIESTNNLFVHMYKGYDGIILRKDDQDDQDY